MNFFLFSTESNQKLLRELIINHKISLFYTNSINQMKFTPTEVCELIIFLLKNNCAFQSELDNLFFTNDNIDIVYPTIFDLFKNKHNKWISIIRFVTSVFLSKGQKYNLLVVVSYLY